MLIDFSDKLQTNVYVLGAVFLQVRGTGSSAFLAARRVCNLPSFLCPAQRRGLQFVAHARGWGMSALASGQPRKSTSHLPTNGGLPSAAPFRPPSALQLCRLLRLENTAMMTRVRALLSFM